MEIDTSLAPRNLLLSADRVFQLAAEKSLALDSAWDASQGTPVFTVEGRYTTRGWTEWTQGFQYGCQILAGEGVGEAALIELGRQRTVDRMLPHVTHEGVHDHGFNNLSTYGNLLRLMSEGTLEEDPWQRRFYAQALAASGAVQASRWSATACGLGYVYSFNGPHSLFIDTMRTLRILLVAHQLGHCLMGENDRRINLLDRAVQHALATAKYIVFRGDSEHTYDVRGRTAHEGTFNRNDGRFRARATQQGYSPFSTWTRGLAWAMLGFAEQLEWLAGADADAFREATGRSLEEVLTVYQAAAINTCDHYIDDVAAGDGITYWDDGAPGLSQLGDWRSRAAEPDNPHEPVDASASAIAAQGLLRLGAYLDRAEDVAEGAERVRPHHASHYRQAGLTVAGRLFEAPYLASSLDHQGLLLHSVYHWPNGWDHVSAGSSVPQGESSMWGDYHLLELALLVRRLGLDGPTGPSDSSSSSPSSSASLPYPTFFAGVSSASLD